ncbi:hypothetical protein CONPUDRAFT_102430 [Coniophora puteana RWD-64-598 SS2]|uniref:Uncharacterized protein n=1 Tax=Coniophora puteana (strain RWD-64-598) TaxID=741705 RepID=A0A5M3MST8_CONPW|nr:uncharacterized protein CONPUDRAFT_102430 [Coniophora puteana RWD-64-598 SS2]EIW81715.1 hypothetical protein CONPUDRAFT_102430 [Coniophora puteana RWD-64-598 SS2]
MDDEYSLFSQSGWDHLESAHEAFVKTNTSTQIYQASLYHQHRCLDTLRMSLINASEGCSPLNRGMVEVCLDYLRQSIHCGADITLEPGTSVTEVNGKKIVGASGVGVPRVCKDWEQLWRWIRSHAYDII